MLELPLATVPEFLRSILPTEAHFPPGTWYFRGQGNADWGLVPTMRRDKAWERVGGARRFELEVQHGLVTSPESELGEQEERILQILANAVQELGLPLELRERDALLAFAQHIGLPTRLLDWTRAPLTAAYFAAADAVQLEGGERLCVYAISAHFLEHSERVKHIERLRAPSYGNPNLVAQQGVLFKVHGEPYDLQAGLPRRRIEAGVALAEADAASVDNHLLAITLPWREAPALLCTLRDQGVHAGTIYPGQRGIAELVREVLRTEPR